MLTKLSGGAKHLRYYFRLAVLAVRCLLERVGCTGLAYCLIVCACVTLLGLRVFCAQFRLIPTVAETSHLCTTAYLKKHDSIELNEVENSRRWL